MGIDLGESEVRVAGLRYRRSGEIEWLQADRFSLPQPIDGEPTSEWLREVMQRLIDRLPRPVDGDNCRAAIALPMSWTQYQTVPGHELSQVRIRSARLFQNSIFRSDTHLCHWPLAGIHCGHPGSDDQYVVAATARRAACHVLEIASSIGYQVSTMLPHAVAMVHSAYALTQINAQCVLWLGEQGSLISVRHATGVGLARSLPGLPAHLVAGQSLCFGSAATSRSRVTLDAFALRPYLSDIASEFRNTSRYAARNENVHASDLPLLIAGPVSEIPGVDESLATLANTPVARWRFGGNRRPTPTSQNSPASDATFSAALSLACAAEKASNRGYGK
ncbi:hypothetical protein C2E31_20425 [Rhodopirellula baltica]|nr:hypothetical protein C2E31_20425 [Rhodopirellula baltica]